MCERECGGDEGKAVTWRLDLPRPPRPLEGFQLLLCMIGEALKDSEQKSKDGLLAWEKDIPGYRVENRLEKTIANPEWRRW